MSEWERASRQRASWVLARLDKARQRKFRDKIMIAMGGLPVILIIIGIVSFIRRRIRT